MKCTDSASSCTTTATTATATFGQPYDCCDDDIDCHHHDTSGIIQTNTTNNHNQQQQQQCRQQQQQRIRRLPLFIVAAVCLGLLIEHRVTTTTTTMMVVHAAAQSPSRSPPSPQQRRQQRQQQFGRVGRTSTRTRSSTIPPPPPPRPRSLVAMGRTTVHSPFSKQKPPPPPLHQQQQPPQQDHQDHHGGDELMSGPTAIANVLADLCPHGMLPIAFGMAAAGGTGPVMATMILLLFGALSWYSLISFARAAEVTLVNGNGNGNGGTVGRPPSKPKSNPRHRFTPSAATTNSVAGESLSAVWERIVPNGHVTKYIPDLGCVCLTIGCLLFYSAFIGDLFGSLVSGWTTILPPMLRRRWSVLLLLHAVPILPLCLIKDLSALKYSSMTGLVGIIYTIVFVGIRLVDQSYAPGGRYYELMPTKFQPAGQVAFPHGSTSSSKSSMLGYVADLPLFHGGKGLLILMNMCCVAYACHYNAVKYYMELKERTVPTFRKVMGIGIGGTALVFWCMMILGYGTFGRNAQTLLLNNYHPSLDTMATIARVFTGIAIISGYALMFAGYKAALFSLLHLDQPNVTNRTTKQNALSFVSLSLIAIAACFVTEHELGTVIGIVGSVFGSVVIYMFPAIINNHLLTMKDRRGKLVAQPFFTGEQLFNKMMILFGVIFAVLGTWISLHE